MNYEVRVARQAERYVRRFDRRAQQRIVRHLAQSADNPRGPYTKPLTDAAGRWASRVSDWRTIFAIDDDRRVVDVSVVGPRGEVYRGI